MSTLLQYAATPQYLRRRVFPLSPHLQYAGILPPLRTPNHQLNSKIEELPAESYREGVVLSSSHQESQVDVGLSKPLTIKQNGLRPGERIILKVTRNGAINGQPATEDEVSYYFGLRTISQTESLNKALEGNYDLRIATSRLGEPANRISKTLTQALNASRKTLILFGSPGEGLNQIAQREGFNLDEKVDFTVNTVPDQGTATVRTEEALSATLAILNYLLHSPQDSS